MNAKSSVFYPAVIVASLLGLVMFVWGWLQFTVTIEPAGPETATLPEVVPPQSLTPSASIPSTPASKPTEPVKQTTPASSTQPAGVASGQGPLRVINQTDQPVRVALLRHSTATSSAAKPYSEPVHWDFAPGEGSSQGLILSLPEGNLQLKKGDILVAFAQDGSRRYWGPYVVGETVAPVWQRQKAEWQLSLQP
jgi:hypothetical protein